MPLLNTLLAFLCLTATSSAYQASDSEQQQQALQNMPPSSHTLSDVIGRDRDISIFAGLVRDVESVSSLLEEKSQNLYILAPSNGAMLAMKSKPWEDAEDYQVLGVGAYEGDDGESRAHQNLRRFVEAHVVVPSIDKDAENSDQWTEGLNGETKIGKTVWWVKQDDKVLIKPDDVNVARQATKVANGAIWVLDSVLKRA